MAAFKSENISKIIIRLKEESKKFPEKSYFISNDLISGPELPKVILIPDSPLVGDKIAGQYMSGRAGKLAKKLFDNYPGLNIKYSDCLVIPKTHIIAENSDELKKIINNYPDFFDRSQESMTEIIYNVFMQSEEIKLWFLHTPGNDKNIFSVFYTTIGKMMSENKKFNNNCFFFNHFSGNNFELDMLRTFYIKNCASDIRISLEESGKRNQMDFIL